MMQKLLHIIQPTLHRFIHCIWVDIHRIRRVLPIVPILSMLTVQQVSRGKSPEYVKKCTQQFTLNVIYTSKKKYTHLTLSSFVLFDLINTIIQINFSTFSRLHSIDAS